MPIIVEFTKRAGQMDEVRQECGPYRVAEVDGDSVSVSDGFQSLILATRTSTGTWVVNGLDGLEFDSFIVLPPREQARAELDAISVSDDESEEPGGFRP